MSSFVCYLFDIFGCESSLPFGEAEFFSQFEMSGVVGEEADSILGFAGGVSVLFLRIHADI